MSEETKHSEPVQYVTFRADTTKEIKEYLMNGGDEIRVTPHADGTKWTIGVYQLGVEMGTQNDSFPCPPFCG